jgi:hypothetical protein
MRITKELTGKIVEKLVEPITLKMAENEEKIKSIVMDKMLSKCPDAVIEFFKLYPKYTNTERSICVHYLGSYKSVYFKEGIPCSDNNAKFEGKVANDIQNLENQITTLKNKKRELSKELEIAILKLGTFARITEQFPEAAAFLPTEKKMEIALNIKDTRNKLKNLP